MIYSPFNTSQLRQERASSSLHPISLRRFGRKLKRTFSNTFRNGDVWILNKQRDRRPSAPPGKISTVREHKGAKVKLPPPVNSPALAELTLRLFFSLIWSPPFPSLSHPFFIANPFHSTTFTSPFLTPVMSTRKRKQDAEEEEDFQELPSDDEEEEEE